MLLTFTLPLKKKLKILEKTEKNCRQININEKNYDISQLTYDIPKKYWIPRLNINNIHNLYNNDYVKFLIKNHKSKINSFIPKLGSYNLEKNYDDYLFPLGNNNNWFAVSGIDLLIKPTEQNLTDMSYYNWVELSNYIWNIYEKNKKLEELISILNDKNLFLFSRVSMHSIIRKRFDKHDGKGEDPGVQGYLIFHGRLSLD